MDNELWLPIVGYEGLYDVSNIGHVRSITGALKKNQTTTKGYASCGLYKESHQKVMKVHRLVYKAFIGTLSDSEQINHINGDKKDNRVTNLEKVSCVDNVNHCYIGKKQRSYFPGVNPYKNKWAVYATVGKERIYLGTFGKEESAGKAYIEFLISRGRSTKYAQKRFDEAIRRKEKP